MEPTATPKTTSQDNPDPAVQVPAPKTPAEPEFATFTDGTPAEVVDPYKGQGGTYVIDKTGKRVPA